MSDGDYADAWRPDPGDTLTGEVEDIAKVTGLYEPYPCLTVCTEEGMSFAFHAFHTVAKQKLVETKPKVGERISITYEGKKKPKDERGSAYHSYRVSFPDRPKGEVDWAAFDASQEAQERRVDPPAPVLADDIPF